MSCGFLLCRLQDAECRGSKSFYTELIASISDMKFTYDGQHILTRDYMNLKVFRTRFSEFLNSFDSVIFLYIDSPIH